MSATLAANKVQALRLVSSVATVTVGAASAQSAVLDTSVYSVVRVISSTACHIEVGSNPTATSSSAYLPADTVEYLRIQDSDRIAVIQNAAGGTLYITYSD